MTILVQKTKIWVSFILNQMINYSIHAAISLNSLSFHTMMSELMYINEKGYPQIKI